MQDQSGGWWAPRGPDADASGAAPSMFPPPPPLPDHVQARPRPSPSVAFLMVVSLLVGAGGALLAVRFADASNVGPLGSPGALHAPSPAPPLPYVGPEPAVRPARWILASHGRFSADGVSFDYPSEWLTLRDAQTHLPDGRLQWATAVGGSGSDLVALGAYAYPAGAPRSTAARAAIADDVVRGMERHMENGHTFQDVSGVEVAGLPGYTFAIAGTLGHASSETEDSAFVLFGRDDYYVVDGRMTNFTEGPVSQVLQIVVQTLHAR